MKTHLIILVLVFEISVYSQETKTIVQDTIRQQGYLLVGTDQHGKLSDITTKFLFIPSVNMDKSLKLSYTNYVKPNFKDLYIPTPYIYDTNDLSLVNFFINKFVNKETKVKLNQEILSTRELLNNSKNLFKFVENSNNTIIKHFKIYYIDGLWVKLKIPTKFNIPITAMYNETRLNKEANKCLEYYFLVETKVISYDVLFTDDSIEIVNK
jgi:hypothetical protein